MKTDDLIAMLASNVEGVESSALLHRYITALGWAAFGATLLMALWLGVRADLSEAVSLPMFWVKLAFPAALLAGALLGALQLARPGARLGRAPLLILVPALLMWALAAVALFSAAPAVRQEMVFGFSWRECPFYIVTLSTPPFIAAFWAMKGLAPTRPALAGATSGLLAGALGALVYALHCPEMAAPFLGIWYLLGMLIPAAAGTLLGPVLLRW